MDMNSDNESNPHEVDMDISPQTSNSLDLNTNQASIGSNGTHVNASQSTSLEVLKVGTVFESDEDAYVFYTKYAKLLGFGVRKDWVNRSKVHGRVVSRKFTCSKEGHRRDTHANVKKHRKETRTGCLAHMIINRDDDGKYRVTHFEGNHNHEVNEIDAEKLQELTCSGTADVNNASESGLSSNLEKRTKLASHFLGRILDTREEIGYPEKNLKNYLNSRRARDMKEGEAAHLLYYFQRQHFENPSFFYSIQLDCEDSISNVFWADDTMIVDYDHFGDVVCLDARYRKDEDFMPFVQFLGLDHHRQLVVFGAALMYDDSFDSIKWLLETFIETMSGKKPKVIHIDQDAAIIQAIDSVLPGVSHRVCVWQMYQNALKHLIHVTKDSDTFFKELRSCIFNHEDEEDFLKAWDVMIEKFNLQQNAWLRWTFRVRENWALIYGKNRYFIDKECNHIGENFSKRLKEHLRSDLEVLQFFKNYEISVDEVRYKELEANYEADRCKPKLMANVALLKHASELYTPKAYEMFQREYEKSLNVVVNLLSENELLFKYKTKVYGQCSEYIVEYDTSETTVTCSCTMFDSVGFLCCHALKVLDHRNIKVVPTRYILKRWTKGGRVKNSNESSGANIEDNPKLIAARRYKELCQRIFKISGRASGSDVAYEYAAKQLDEVIRGVEKILSFESSDENCAITYSNTGTNASENEQAVILLNGSATEVENEGNTGRGTCERANTRPDNGQVNNLHQEQCVFNFGASNIVQSLYPQSSILYQSPDFLPNQNDSAYPAQILQESLSHINHLRLAMDIDDQRPHSTLFMHNNQRHRLSNGHNYGSKQR